jgi:hypothetical protein
MKDYLYPHWRKVYNSPPSTAKDDSMRTIKVMTKGNLHWFIRQLIGGLPSDGEQWVNRWVAEGKMLEPSVFTRQRRYENSKRKNS